ncbi:MAG: hypothetical protein ACTSRS_16630 [Candidatus Helarchaeota archaeon]
MTKFFRETFSNQEVKAIKQCLECVREIFKRTVETDAKLFLIGMKGLYYYYGITPFLPAPVSLDIDINFDILANWTNYRKLIPQEIKRALEKLGYNIKVDLGLITIQKEDVLIHLTTVIEYSEEIIGDRIPSLGLDVADKNFILYTKLSRFDQYRDMARLQNLFNNCTIEVNKILNFAPELEKSIIQDRIELLKSRTILRRK